MKIGVKVGAKVGVKSVGGANLSCRQPRQDDGRRLGGVGSEEAYLLSGSLNVDCAVRVPDKLIGTRSA